MSAIACSDIAAKIASYREDALVWLQEMIRFPSVQGDEAGVQAYIKWLF